MEGRRVERKGVLKVVAWRRVDRTAIMDMTDEIWLISFSLAVQIQ